MADRPLLPHWQIMREFDEEMLAKSIGWRDCITHNGIIPLKQKELMMVAMCCVLRFHAGIKVHAQYALNEGATKEELFATAALSMLFAGVPAYREGILTIKELF